MMMAVKANNSFTSLEPNVASALCYVPFIGSVAAMVLLIAERNQTVKWNAVQSLVLFALWFVGMFLVFVGSLIGLAGFVLYLVLAVKTYQGETVRLPVLGGWADKIIKKV